MPSHVALVADVRMVSDNLAQIFELEQIPYTQFDYAGALSSGVADSHPGVVVFDVVDWTPDDQSITRQMRAQLPASAKVMLITSSPDLSTNVPDSIDSVVLRPYHVEDLLSAIRRALVG